MQAREHEFKSPASIWHMVTPACNPVHAAPPPSETESFWPAGLIKTVSFGFRERSCLKINEVPSNRGRHRKASVGFYICVLACASLHSHACTTHYTHYTHYTTHTHTHTHTHTYTHTVVDLQPETNHINCLAYLKISKWTWPPGSPSISQPLQAKGYSWHVCLTLNSNG
jgi:hypothetical protein